jgi:phosphatidylserine/phosphatidylglycerophosphate/cardiolipin synthase-like enzyme
MKTPIDRKCYFSNHVSMDERDAPFTATTIEQVSGTPFTDGNRVSLLWKGPESFHIIFDEIALAKKLICLEFYIFRNDETGNELGRSENKALKVGSILYDHWLVRYSDEILEGPQRSGYSYCMSPFGGLTRSMFAGTIKR